MLSSLYACLLGFTLDLVIGDSRWKLHPIRLIGNLIGVTEVFFRKIFPDTDKGKLIAGLCMTFCAAMVAMIVPLLLLIFANRIDPLAAFFLESIMCAFAFSTKNLKTETMKIYQLLSAKKIEESKEALSRVVRRDTKNLSEEEIIKAAVETIAENTTDGVIAPMVFMLIGGAPFAYFYKVVHTMDSIVGYKDDKHMFFRRYVEKLHDTLNYFPARIAAYIMIFASYILKKFDGKNAKIIYKRDRLKHANLSSTHTEAVYAGALRIQLAGNILAFGVKQKKEYIGEPLEKITSNHIVMANKLLYATAGMSLLLLSLLKFLIIY